ncbi:MAG: hypothetical protein ABJH05_07940 [Fulvivirga sp.]
MKPASLPELRKELKTRDADEIMQICLRLARFKKDNKELLTYLLFDADNEAGYIEEIKYEIDDLMGEMNTSHIYYAKKSLRKIMRNLNKYIRYSGNKQTEVEILLYFAKAMRDSPVNLNRSSVLSNMYDRLIIKIEKALKSLHQDVQLDYKHELAEL